jgi:HEPN domain-containing protein
MTPVVAGYFQVLREDLSAARQLAPTVPRASAFHLQQAAEKLVKAVLSAEGIHIAVEHDIGQLVAKLPAGHAWKADLMELDYLSRFATAFRYPSPSGRVAPPPDRVTLDRYAGLVQSLADDAEAWAVGRG